MKFSNWDENIHSDIDQLKRISNALKIKKADITIDEENSSAVIKGRDGSYNVNLEQCECKDFSVRHLPCKHIYKLAAELGIINIDGELPTINQEQVDLFNQTIPKEIEKYKTLFFNGAISLEKFLKIVNALQSK